MKNMKEMSSNDAYEAVSKLGREWHRIKIRFSDMIEHWTSLAPNYFKTVATVTVDEDKLTLTGSALGKDFTVQLSSKLREDGLAGKISVLVPAVASADKLLAAEYFIYPDGRVIDNQGIALVDENTPDASTFRLLCIAINDVAMS